MTDMKQAPPWHGWIPEPLKHSPTPWMIVRSGDEDGATDYLYDATGRDISYHYTSNDQSRTDRAFMLRAVNSHDALVVACRELLAWCSCDLDNDRTLRQIVSAVEAALNLAGATTHD